MRHQTSDDLGLLAEIDKPTKMPWFLRWPAAVRQWLNQWNWRQKTALVTALAITAAGTFAYQYKANAAIAWPAVFSRDFLVKLFVSIGVSRTASAAFNTKLQKTANANPDGWLYRNREYYRQDYSYSDNGSTKTKGLHIDAKAMAAQDKTYDTSGTHSRWNPSDMDPDEVLDFVSDNTNLRRGQTETYQVLEFGEPLYTWGRYTPQSKNPVEWSISWGGYVKKPTAAEIQEELDEWRETWNNDFQRGRSNPNRRPARLLGPLTLGPIVSRTVKSFTLDKEVKLWSDFGCTRVPGDTSAGPNELQQPGQRPNYVTSFSYYAREAGYGPYHGLVVTRTPDDEEPFIDYPEPKSWEDHDFMPFDLTQIPWSNFKIIGSPVWSGESTRFFKHKKIRNWCNFCSRQHTFVERWFQRGWLCRNTQWCTRHEIAVYQNESVTKP